LHSNTGPLLSKPRNSGFPPCGQHDSDASQPRSSRVFFYAPKSPRHDGVSTIGAFVRSARAADPGGLRFLLSNTHVVAPESGRAENEKCEPAARRAPSFYSDWPFSKWLQELRNSLSIAASSRTPLEIEPHCNASTMPVCVDTPAVVPSTDTSPAPSPGGTVMLIWYRPAAEMPANLGTIVVLLTRMTTGLTVSATPEKDRPAGTKGAVGPKPTPYNSRVSPALAATVL
jgi:hypothetical protein